MSFAKILRPSERTSNSKRNLNFDQHQLISVLYHDIFDYPLNSVELFKWKVGKKVVEFSQNRVRVETKLGYFFQKGRNNLVPKRLMREKVSKDKFEKARRVGDILTLLPSVKMVAVTGALAMNNSSKESDIDLMIIAEKGTLWVTRGVVWMLLKAFRFPLRIPGDKNEKDKLCLNIWLDSTDLAWSEKERNIFTAHEIAQVVPLVNKNGIYEKFLSKNSWIKDYWPNAVDIRNQELGIMNKGIRRKKSIIQYLIHNSLFIIRVLELMAFKLQYFYMKDKITRETITPTRALFHPVDWKKIVLSRLA